MNIIDAVIIIILIAGFLLGFKRGVIKELITLVGVVLVISGAFYLKNPIANFCYRTLPFINFKVFNGLSILNILFYEVISFLIAASVLALILKIALTLSKIVEKILKATIVLGIFSKVLGGILGILESYVIIFVLLFFFNQPFVNITGIGDSKLGTFILTHTPVLSNKISGTVSAIDELYSMKDNYNEPGFEKETVETFLKYKVVSTKSLKILKEKNKINFGGIDNLIKKYGG